MLKASFKQKPALIDDTTPFFGSPCSSPESPLTKWIKADDKMSDHEEENDIAELNAQECEIRQHCVRKNQVELKFFSNKQPSLSTKSADEDDDELGYYYTEHDGYKFKVVLHEPIREEMDANTMYVSWASKQRIAYKVFAPNQEHVPKEHKHIIKDFIPANKLRDFNHPLTPANLSPCLEDIIDITKERGHTPGFGELSFDLAFKG